MTKQTVKLLIILAIFSSFITCSSGLKQSESIAQKMERFAPKKDSENPVPTYKLVESKNLFAKSRSRGPASVTKNNIRYKENTNYSNKRLYFITLLSQYDELRKFTADPKEKIISCPHFHNTFLTYNKTNKTNNKSAIFTLKQPTLNKALKNISMYPELMLPVNNQIKDHTVYKQIKDGKNPDAVITKAINYHIQKTKNELTSLCEMGKSNNYYTFENLVRHITNSGQMYGSNQSLYTILKTPIFNNLLLLKSLKTSLKDKSVNDYGYAYELTNRMKIPWVVTYLERWEELKKQH